MYGKGVPKPSLILLLLPLGNLLDYQYRGRLIDMSQIRLPASGKSNTGIFSPEGTVRGYDVLKTQSACVMSERKLEVTKSDLHNRIVYEFDGRPCGEVYAEVLGVPVEEIQNYFVSNPLGIVADGEIFVRTFNQIQDGGITLHCGLPEGAEINVLKIGDIVADTRQALDNIITYEPAGVINFNCLYRTFEMLNKKLTADYCALWGKYPSIPASFPTSHRRSGSSARHSREPSSILRAPPRCHSSCRLHTLWIYCSPPQKKNRLQKEYPWRYPADP